MAPPFPWPFKTPLPEPIVERLTVTEATLCGDYHFSKPAYPELCIEFRYVLEASFALVQKWKEAVPLLHAWEDLWDMTTPMYESSVNSSYWNDQYTRVTNGTEYKDIVMYELLLRAWTHAAETHTLYAWKGLPIKQARFPDFVLKAGSREEKVHACILDIYAPLLLTGINFQEGMKLDIMDMSPSTLSTLVRHMYTGDYIYERDEEAFELLAFTDKYNIISLQLQVVHFLCEDISWESAEEFFDVGMRYKCPFLSRSIAYYYSQFPIEEEEPVFNEKRFKGAMLAHILKKQRKE